MTPDEYTKLKAISQMLNEAYEHYFSYEGHCKSSEAHISIGYGTLWDRQDDPADLKIKEVNIYSYVFAPKGREAYFDSVDEALEEVTRWYEKEMAYDPNTPEEIEAREKFDAFALDFIREMQDSGRLTVLEIELPEDEDGRDDQ